MRPSKRYKLIKCPECDKIGLLHKYTDGSAVIEHQSHAVLGAFNQIDKSCYFKDWQS